MELKAYDQYLRVNPVRGATITHLKLKSPIHEKLIISPQKGYQYESALLFPFPNRLAKGQYDFEGQSYQFPLNDFGPPNAVHGILYDQPFEVIEKSETLVKLAYHYKGGLSYYPFPFRVEVSYELLPAQLDVTIVVSNTGKNMLPGGFGWHPYFNLEEKFSDKMWLSEVECIEVDEYLIPTGKVTPYKKFEIPSELCDVMLDTCFRFVGDVKNRNTSLFFLDGSHLEIYQDQYHPYVQVFTPPDGKTIAIEPMTCPINALKTKEEIVLLQPDNDWNLNFGVRLG